jgi:hypothetical protein
MFVDSNFRPRLRSQCRRTVSTSVAAALTLCSCNNDKVEVYRIPKEGINVAMQGATGSLAPPSTTDRPVHGPNRKVGSHSRFLRCGLKASKSTVRMPVQGTFRSQPSPAKRAD